jgi:hypothetical protein
MNDIYIKNYQELKHLRTISKIMSSYFVSCLAMPRAATFMSDEGNRARVVENLTDISDEDDLLPKSVVTKGCYYLRKMLLKGAPIFRGLGISIYRGRVITDDPSSTRGLDSRPNDGYPTS